jgi:hypothetical protein
MADTVSWPVALTISLITSFFTALVTEPTKAALERRRSRKKLRRALYSEIMENFVDLFNRVDVAKRDERAICGIGAAFAAWYRRKAFEKSSSENAVGLYDLGQNELYWIELAYRTFDQVANGKFDSDQQRLANAEFAASIMPTDLKNRHLSKCVMFSVSSEWVKKYLRETLPAMEYVMNEQLELKEQVLRRWDRVEYWWWRRLSH